MPKETSEEVGKIASKYMNITPEELLEEIGESLSKGAVQLHTYLFMFTRDIRTLAASCLSQTEPNAGND